MAYTKEPNYPAALASPGVTILPADTTARKDLFTAGAQGAIINAISASNNETSTKFLNFYIYDGSTERPLCAVPMTNLAGTSTSVAALDVMRHANFAFNAVDAYGNRCLKLAPNHVLRVASSATVTALKQIDVVAQGVQL